MSTASRRPSARAAASSSFNTAITWRLGPSSVRVRVVGTHTAHDDPSEGRLCSGDLGLAALDRDGFNDEVILPGLNARGVRLIKCAHLPPESSRFVITGPWHLRIAVPSMPLKRVRRESHQGRRGLTHQLSVILLRSS